MKASYLLILAGAVFVLGNSVQAIPMHQGGFHAGAMHQPIHPSHVNQDQLHSRHPEAKTGVGCSFGLNCHQGVSAAEKHL